MALPAKQFAELALSVEDAQQVHNAAVRDQHAVVEEEAALLNELKSASMAGDHLRVVEARAQLDNLAIRKWSTDLAAARASLGLLMAQHAKSTKARVALHPELLRLDRRISDLQRKRERLVGEIEGARGQEAFLNYEISDARAKIVALENAEAGWAPPLRSIRVRRA